MSTGSDLWCPSPQSSTPFWAIKDVFKTFSKDNYKETLIIIGYPRVNFGKTLMDYLCARQYIFIIILESSQ